MKSFPSDSQANIQRVGSFARHCLTSKRQGKVLAAVSKAIYLRTEQNEIFWLTTQKSPMHRRCAQISSPLPSPSGIALFKVEDQRLIIDESFVINIANPFLWNTRFINRQRLLDVRELPSQVNTLFSNLDFSQAKGFGNFIPSIHAVSKNQPISPSAEDPILRFAQPHITEIARACFHHQFLEISSIADSLIGLGSGLTPSGDDFLGGMLFAIKILQATYPNATFSGTVVPIDPYKSRTHLISFTLLNDLADGYGIEPLHQIINGILSGEASENISPFISQLIQLGNSTGWDLLTGLLTGLLVTYQNTTSPVSRPSHRDRDVHN